MNPTSSFYKKFHLPQLDGLRFFAFFLVFVHHFNPLPISTKASHHLMWIIENKLFVYGWIGVDIFLCLSSFLLTSLIIMEYKNTGSFSIKNFLIRRMLRIWPLYYLILFLGFAFFPLFNYNLVSPHFHTPEYHIYLKQHLLPFILFMGNFSYAYFLSSLTVIIAPLWSISLEEQFYLLCPLILLILLPKNKKWFIGFCITMILISLAVRFYIITNSIPYPTVWVFSLARLEPFALGALLSFFYVNNSFKTSSLYALMAFLFSALLLKCLTSSNYTFASTWWYLFGIDLACLLLIYAVIQSKTLSMLFSIKIISWLGKISFGLYVFHKIVIYFMAILVLPYFYNILKITEHPILFYWFSFITTLIGSILLAALSYYSFEKYFLTLKKKYTAVSSRPI